MRPSETTVRREKMHHTTLQTVSGCLIRINYNLFLLFQHVLCTFTRSDGDLERSSKIKFQARHTPTDVVYLQVTLCDPHLSA